MATTVTSATVAVSAGGVNWITGAWGERSTADELQRLGPDWRIAHNLVFHRELGDRIWEFDVDHVAVGPGGVLVVESKYTTTAVELDGPYLSSQIRGDAEQASRNARLIRQLLATAGAPVTVTPVLVYWGFRLRAPVEPIRELGRVQVVVGGDAKRWRPRLRAGHLDPQTADVAWNALAAQRRDSVARVPVNSLTRHY